MEQQTREQELARLQYMWATRYSISESGGVWRAQKLANAAILLRADTPMELRGMMLRDWAQ